MDRHEDIADRINNATCPHCGRKVGQLYYEFVDNADAVFVSAGRMATRCPYAATCQGWIVFKNPYRFKTADRVLVPATNEPRARCYRSYYLDAVKILGSEQTFAERMTELGMPGAFANYPWD